MMSLTELAESTAFETFALESTAALQLSARRRSGVYDLRTGSGKTFLRATAAAFGRSGKLQLDLRPLMFGVAWKILDRVVEYAAGTPQGKHTPVAQKVTSAISCSPPAPFSNRSSLWKAIVTTYDATQELRNGLIHRHAEITHSRELRVLNRSSGRVDILNSDQQLAICRLSQRVISCIVAGKASDRDLFDLSNQLRQLAIYSGHTQIIGRDVTDIYELIDSIPVDSGGTLRVDVRALLACARKKFSNPTYIDFIGYIEGDETSVLTGALDEAEPRIYEFTRSDLPAWLHLETRLTP